MRIVYVVGTRPNFVKMAPVIAALRRRLPDGRHAVVHTGQHYDRLMSEIFVEELGVPEPDHLLGVGSGSHGEQTARVIERLEPVLAEERPDVVLVPGDVNSTL
ncbi:MAG: UDP-N-acetylglucosamine 2-epimerase, partial [Solirubrobacterales bacterium]